MDEVFALLVNFAKLARRPPLPPDPQHGSDNTTTGLGAVVPSEHRCETLLPSFPFVP